MIKYDIHNMMNDSLYERKKKRYVFLNYDIIAACEKPDEEKAT